MELSNFVMFMMRRTNMKLMLMLFCVTVCVTVILLSSHLLMSAPDAAVSTADVHVEADRDDDSERIRYSDPEEVEPVVSGLAPLTRRVLTNERTVAIGCAITSHNEEHLSLENIAYKLPFLKSLVPSFCKTISPGFDYHFYIAFDMHDPNFGKEKYLAAIDERFNEDLGLLCPKQSSIQLHFVQCNHNHNPTWAQNDAMIEAYLDNIDYYYR